MLDLKRLSKNKLLLQNGWRPEHEVDIKEKT